MDHYKIVLQNIERLRTNYGLERNEIDEFGDLETGTYQNAIEETTILDVKQLISIAKVFMLEVPKIFNPRMRMPSFKDLPSNIQKIAYERLGKTERVIQKKDYIQYCIAILNKHFKIGDDFTNLEIKAYLTDDLKRALKSKSIEWDKSIIADCVLDTKTTRSGKTKPQNVYQLIKEIPTELVNKAIEVVGIDWLENNRKSGNESKD